MQLVVFLLIGGIWAAVLLPSFFSSRRRTPLNTTRNFARTKYLLALVTGANANEAKARRRAAVRRKRVLSILALGAGLSLTLAVYRASLIWLAATIAFDIALAVYVTLMLQVTGGSGKVASVVRLVPVDPEKDTQHHTVRVVAS